MENTSEMTDRTLQVLSFGAGAIGTYIGGSLALQGHRVIFLERPEVAEELSQRGLQLTINDQTHAIPSPLVAGSLSQALDLGPLDVALFALKSFDTGPALEMIAPLADRFPPVLCLQNGVENESALAEILGSNKVIAGSVTSAIGRRAAGNIILERLRGMGVAAGHPLSEKLVDALSSGRSERTTLPRACLHEVVQDAHQPAGECKFCHFGYDAGRDLFTCGFVPVRNRPIAGSVTSDAGSWDRSR